jgi:hypothetical protein
MNFYIHQNTRSSLGLLDAWSPVARRNHYGQPLKVRTGMSCL